MLAVLALPLILAACAAPVRVEKISARTAQADLTRSVLSSGMLSEKARQLLHRTSNEERWQRDPAGVLESLHAAIARPLHPFDAELRATLMDAVAELAFAHASKSGDRSYYLAAALYAWIYLLPAEESLQPSALDRGVRLSADIYNRGIALAFSDPESGRVVLRDGEHELPFGILDVDYDEESGFVGEQEMGEFVSLTDLRVRGLNNRYRISGLGAPLAARLIVDPSETEAGTAEEHTDAKTVFGKVRVPVAALLDFDLQRSNVYGADFFATLTVIPFAREPFVEIQGHTVPLAFEPSAALALQLTEEPPWKREINGFFRGDLALGPTGLISMNPFRSNRIPIVLVHGTASSAGRWADLVNDLTVDPVLRRYFQVWLFQYNTGNPIAYSGWLLRSAIDELVEKLDPDGTNPTLRDLVVMGHSQGGLLTKLLTVDSGEVFWRQAIDKPPDEVELAPESRRLLEGSLMIEPSPYVTRVIFLATPHRGSRLADLAPARLLSRFVRSPANLVNAVGDLFQEDAVAEVQRRLSRSAGAIGNMSPQSPFIKELAEMQISPRIHAHSIIGVSGEPKEESDDGVVSYESAHLDGVESERVVRAKHSSQADPEVISEVRRILILHIEDAIERGLIPANGAD